jgi:alcohol dehydrogenase
MKSHVSPPATQEVRKGAALPSLSPFDFQPLTRLIFGSGSLTRLGEVVAELGGTRVFLVTDPGLEAAGHPQRAIISLQNAGLEVVVFDGVEQNPTTRHVDKALAIAKAQRVDFLVAVGGGSSMDCAKGVNFLFFNGGALADYKGFGKATKPMLPSVAVPTTAGTGSEAQSYALIADDETHMKMACGDKKAAFRAAILDPDVTVSQPPKVTAVTGIDAISHALETYVCTRRNTLSQAFAREAWRHLEPNFERVLRDPADIDARGAMQLGAHFAGLAIENSMLGACHACANPLTAHYGITHGVAIGILLPHVIRFNALAVAPLYAELGHEGSLLNGDPAAAPGILAQRVTKLMHLASLPTTLSACDVRDEILPLLAAEAAQQWTGKFNPRPVSEPELLQLYRTAY